MEANFMNCSRSRTHWLRFASLGFAGALVAAGCGGSSTRKDGGVDGGGDAGLGLFRLMPPANDFGSVETGKMSAPFNFMPTNMGGGPSGQPMITVSNGEFTAS